MMNSEDTFDSARFKRPLIMMIIFWILAVVLWQTTGLIFYMYNFVYLCIALGIGLGLYRVLPKRQNAGDADWLSF